MEREERIYNLESRISNLRKMGAKQTSLRTLTRASLKRDRLKGATLDARIEEDR
jgi:hypothetical protein